MNGNVGPDLLRQGIQQPTILMNNSSFMQNTPQPGQPQLGPNHLGMPQNAGAGAGMMLANSASGMNNSQQRYHIPMPQQTGSRQTRPMDMRQGQPGGQPMMNSSVGSVPSGGPPHMGGVPHSQPGMSFTTGMMQHPPNPAVRRVSSQPQMNSGSGPLGGGMSSGVNNMNMNPQGNVGMRQVAPQMRIFIQPQMHNGMSPDMPMVMSRPGGNPGMAPGRTGSAQPMNSLSQPPSLPHSLGPHQNQFQNPAMAGQHQQPQMSSPRAGSHTPSMSMATPGPSHTPTNRPQMTPDNAPMNFMNFPNTQFLQPHNRSHMQAAGGQFGPFVPSSTSPIPMADMPQPMPGMGTPGGTPTRPGFPPTPAQQLEQMNLPPEAYSSHFGMPPPLGPPRPPSRPNHHPPLPLQQQHSSQPPQHHHSPPQSEQINPHPQRPQSQPPLTPRPPSQPVPQSHTPRPSQTQLPPGAPPPQPGPRMGQHHSSGPPPGYQMQVSGNNPHLPIAPRQPQVPSTSASSTNPPALQAPSNTPPSGSTTIPRAPQTASVPLGNGQGLIRLLQFSGVLASENKTKLQLAWWNDLVQEYFTPKAVMKFTLWKDNQRNEAKPFEIGVPILPRFFLVTTQSGVKSMTLTLDGARERMYAQGHAIVECVAAVWTYKYHNGYTVTLRGPLTAHVVITSPYPPGAIPSQASTQFLLKFEDFQFDANFHDKFIALESIMGARVMESPKTPRVVSRNVPTPTPNGIAGQQQQLEEDKRWEEPRVTIERASIPGEPVNAFGIPQATMRCLELAESVAQMTDLITFSTESELGPIEALSKFAIKLREMQLPFIPTAQANVINGVNANPANAFSVMHGNINNVAPTPAVTLYSSAPPSVTNPSGNPPPSSSMNSPKNPPSASNSPQKQHKTIPHAQGSAASSVTAASPSVSSGTTTNTPSLANASLKRPRGSDAASPTVTAADPHPPKRVTRKRGRTTGGG